MIEKMKNSIKLKQEVMNQLNSLRVKGTIESPKEQSIQK